MWLLPDSRGRRATVRPTASQPIVEAEPSSGLGHLLGPPRDEAFKVALVMAAGLGHGIGGLAPTPGNVAPGEAV